MGLPLVGLLLAGLAAGCGAVGSPVAPESIGVAAQQARERDRAAKAAAARKEPAPAPMPAPAEPAPAAEAEEDEGEILPEVRPDGTR